MSRPGKHSARPSRALSPTLALVECPAPVYILGAGLGTLFAIIFLIVLGVFA
jgi:hypothetical protein